jgi:peptide/nickel transport system permease protein
MTTIAPKLATSAPSAGASGKLRKAISAVPLGVNIALLFLVLAALVVAFPQWFTHQSPLEANPLTVFRPPGDHSLLGTDELGRDVYTRIIYGARYSIFIGAAATAIGIVVGVIIGLIAGLGGKVTDEIATRVLDVIASFPGILLAIVLITIVGRGIPTLIVALGLWSVPRYARIVRAETKLVKDSGHVEQAVTLGLRQSTLVVRHIVPHAIVSVPILATMGLGSTILAASSLSFLGLGAQPPSPEWGAMLADGRNYINNAWWISVFPGIAIVLVVLSVSTVGRYLQRRLERRNQL